ncbi:MAG: folate-binding protein [Geminicoccaceae bacterium]|nr:folate-binding protein [Geminicoccaceae bacterium]
MRLLELVPLEGRAVLEVDGADARSFLQGLVTNDVRKLAADRALWAALLTPQGRCLFEFAMVADGARILLEAERARCEELARRLAFYRLRAAVEIADRSTAWTVVALPDPAAAERFELPLERGACRALEDAILFVDPRLAAMGVRGLVRREALDRFLARHGLVLGEPAAYERHRLELGVPEGAIDLPPQKALPLEADLDALDAISFDKGCFVGQELTARMEHRGLVKKRLVPVRVTGPLPPPGTPVRQGEREVGEVRSGLDGRALALVRLEALGGGPLTADGATLEPVLPAWLREEIDP